LLAVVIIASRYRQGPSAVAALVAIGLFDFFFVHPYYTFAVSDVRYVLTFGVMLLVALVMGNLTGRIRTQAESAREREQRSATLYSLSRDLTSARSQEDVVAATIRNIRETFPGDSAVFVPDVAGRVEPVTSVGYPYTEHERTVAQWVFDHATPAGQGTSTLPAAAAMYLPLTSSERTMGVLGIRAVDPSEFRDPARRRLIEALASQAAAALERLVLAERSRQTEIEVEAEHLRTALLSSLSHDMRTPLASIEGSASALLQESGPIEVAIRRELAATILQEAQRMSRLVANLLDMIRVETGALQVQKEWQLLSDVVGVALLRVEDRLSDHPVVSRLPSDLPLVPVDEILLEQVFVNLLENAAKHTPSGTPIEIGAEARPGEVVAFVADRGPGLPPGDADQVFRKFYRGGSGSGIGLGLTICRGIITAHGGRIWAENRPGGGAVFRFTLPISGTPPSMVPEAMDSTPQELEVGTSWTTPPRSSS
jgi:two-component system, OmpR family, sensor histidine kinase KdpD